MFVKVTKQFSLKLSTILFLYLKFSSQHYSIVAFQKNKQNYQYIGFLQVNKSEGVICPSDFFPVR